MNKKTAGRISAMAMASMMMMSVCVVNAAAEENGDNGWKYIPAKYIIFVSCGEW